PLCMLNLCSRSEVVHKMLFVVVHKDILSNAEHASDHRVLFRNELDNAAWRQRHQPFDEAAKRHVSADDEVVNEGKSQNGICVSAFKQPCTLLLIPAPRRTRIAAIHDQGKKVWVG